MPTSKRGILRGHTPTSLTRMVVVVLCFMVVVQAKLYKKRPSYCLAQNPLIGMLKQNKVTVFDNPVQSMSPVCASEWKQHKTCCHPTSLISYAKKEAKVLRMALKSVRFNAVMLKDSFKKNKKLILKALEEKSVGDKRKVIQEIIDQLNVFQTSIEEVFEDNRASKVSLNACFQRIEEIKTNSLCYTCSGRSAHFFLKGLALMGEADCRQTVSKCVSTWHQSVRLVDAMELARKVLSKLAKIIPKRGFFPISVKSMQKLQEWIGTHKIRDAVKHCDESLESCSYSSQKLLCEAFISLRSKDFLSQVGSDIVHEVKKTAPSGTVPADQTSQTSLSRTKWALERSRVLTAGTVAPEQPIILENKQDIQVVKCNQTSTGSAPMPLSGSILTANETLNQPPLLGTGQSFDGSQP